MSQKKNLIQIATQIASITGCTQDTAEAFIKSLFSLLTDLIQQGKKVKIKGIGTFKKGENNNDIILYEPDKQLSAIVNLPFSSFEPVELDDDVNDDVFNQEINNSSLDTTQTEISLNQETLESVESNDTNLKRESDNTLPKLDLNQSEEDNEIKESDDAVSTQDDLIEEVAEPTINDDGNNLSIEDADDTDGNNEVSIAEEPRLNNGKIKIGIPMYILSIIFALFIGFGGGYFFKTLNDDNVLNQRIDNQQKQLDSIQSAIKNEQKDTIIEQPKDTIKYDTVKINRYITNMAKEYYGDLNFWSYIYEENKEQLGHPERIYPGTVVKIPSASKYGIDATDPASVQRAKVKAIEIYAKFRK